MTGLPSIEELARLPLEEGKPIFVEPWAARAFSIVVGLYDRQHYAWPEWVDYFSAELAPPGHYRQTGSEEAKLSGDVDDIETHYFEFWLAACEKLLVAKGLMTRGEFERKVAGLTAAAAPATRFQAGDGIVVRDVEPVGHAHLPLYVRGKSGVVERDLGTFVYPDGEEKLQHVYSICFRARELWGQDASARDSLFFNLYDGYLEPA